MSRIFIFFFLTLRLVSQIPDSDIWLLRLKDEKGQLKVEKATNITSRAGYDNQPAFSADQKKIFYVSIGESKQADIFVYDIGSSKAYPFTKTKESEYSPTLSPDGKNLVCVAVMSDSSQRLVSYSLTDLKDGQPKNTVGAFLTDIDSVGYFTFLNYDTLIYYKLTRPHTLLTRSISNGAEARIAENPVRGFKRMGRSGFIYGVKDSAGVSYYKYESLIRKAAPYCRYHSQAEDIIWHPSWGLMKSEKSAILRYDAATAEWKAFLDVSAYGIKQISRFAFSTDNKKLLLSEVK